MNICEHTTSIGRKNSSLASNNCIDRKYTEMKAKNLGLYGWCMNTERGTVTGKLEGSQQKVEEMKKWLTNEGSPKSKIEKADFKNQQTIAKLSFKQFSIRR